ncbi:MAG: ABC transporter ATP-binding protein [Dehalococcoidia bacterium]|nr:ABC transporter ATP-binding protein [Dehalococcoidia bacterium]
MLKVRDLHKNFVVGHGALGRFQHPDHVIKAVDGVSFDVAAGEILGIVGESGSGKTTLARTILRLSRADSGSVRYRGVEVLDMQGKELKQFRREVQPIFQDADSTLDPHQSVSSILQEPLLIHGVGDEEQRRWAVSAVMRNVNLAPSFLNRHPSELSGGQRQRVAMGRALLLEPRLIVADEPTSGLDPLVAAQILSLLLGLKRERGLSIVLITHDLDTVAYASDRVGVMYRGRVVETIGGAEFRHGALHPYTRLLLGLDEMLGQPVLQEGVHEHVHVFEQGCAYVNSCPHHVHECHHDSPALREVSPGHFVACHVVGQRRELWRVGMKR